MADSASPRVSHPPQENGNKLLRELEALSHALLRSKPPANNPSSKQRRASEYHHRGSNPSARSHSSISTAPAAAPSLMGETREEETGHSGGIKRLLDWKPLRALSHIGQHKFHCIFIAHVHTITGLSAGTNGARLTVGFGHRDSHSHTLPSRISHQRAEFDEPLSIRCSVYGSKKASRRMKYSPKFFLVSVIATDADEPDAGQFRLDLTELLPVSMDSKDLDKSLSFQLDGKARGATLTITFGYEILDKEFRHKSVADDSELGSISARTELQHLNPMPYSPQTTSTAQQSNSLPGGRVTFRPRSLSHSENLSEDDHSSSDPRMKRIPRGSPFFFGNSDSQAIRSRWPSQPRMGVGSPLEDDYADFEVVDRGVEISSLCVNPSLPLPPTLEGDEEGFDPSDQPAEETQPLADLPSIEESDGKAVGSMKEEKSKDRQIYSKVQSAPIEDPPSKQIKSGTKGKEFVDTRSAEKRFVSIGSEETDFAGIGSKGKVVADIGSKENAFVDIGSTRKGLFGIRSKETGSVEKDCGGIGSKEIGSKGKDFAGVRSTEEGTDKPKIVDPIDEKNLEVLLGTDTKTHGAAEVPNLADEADLVAGEFLHMLEEDRASKKNSSESESNSPKALLLRQFEQEALLEGGIGLALCFSHIPDFQLDDLPAKGL